MNALGPVSNDSVGFSAPVEEEKPMSKFDPAEFAFAARLRVLQIMTLGLFMGCAFFGAIVLMMQPQGQANFELLVYLAAGFLVVQILLAAVLPMFTLPGQLRRIARGDWKTPPVGMGRPGAFEPGVWFGSDAGKLLAVYQGQQILRMALIEGGAFVNGIAALVVGSQLSLTLLGVGAGLILLQFPTAGRVTRWLETQLEELDRLRAQGDFVA
jgi:hypothetical protein